VAASAQSLFACLLAARHFSASAWHDTTVLQTPPPACIPVTMSPKYPFLTAALSLGVAFTNASAKTFKDATDKAEITVDASAAPDLLTWAEQELSPVVAQWYPKIAAMLKSDGYTAPDKVTILFRDGMNGVPAWTQGNRISCNTDWYKQNLKGEAKGCTIHELVHVVQQYGRGNKIPGWITEGIPDYIRWFLYEPESHGAEISEKRAARVNYDASYRISGNFFNWITAKYPINFVEKLNASAREGKYEESLWKTLTGKTVQELGASWKESLTGTTTVANEAPANTLTDAEKAEGWQLLFNGKDIEGWHNFKATTIKPGWQVKDGTLACVDPHNASDLCTKEQYDWFDLQLDYNISEGGNSGIIFHATEDGGAVWATGPEFQLEDNVKAADAQRCGWLYGLYQPEIDPATGKTLDATKPAGTWNHVRLLLTKEKVVHEINGVKYFEYQLGSEDFKKRVAASKFGAMPKFAKFDKGFLALQGDHGQVSFRNIKIKPITAKP
jgi:hypothetical protein